jgi:hypothetical protein
VQQELFIIHSLLRTGTQQGLTRWQLQLGMGSEALVQHCQDGTGGFQLENQQGQTQTSGTRRLVTFSSVEFRRCRSLWVKSGGFSQ